MSCEKASRRLRFLLSRAKRLGLAVDEVAELPGAKKLLSARVTSASWTILAIISLILGGGVILAYLCTPCVARSRI